MKKVIEEFKEFISKGNVIDLAVGVIIGASFGKIVTSLVNDVIMPLIGVILGGISFTDLNFKIKDATITYGNFIQNVIDFLIVAFCIFIFVKAINALTEKAKILFPSIIYLDGTTFNKMDEAGNITSTQFMVIIYVNTKISGENAIILKQWLEKELSSEVILNIQMTTNTPTQIISGNGIDW